MMRCVSGSTVVIISGVCSWMRAPYENSPPVPSRVSHLMPRSDSSACKRLAERANQIERQQVAAPAAKDDAPPGAAAR